MIINDQIDKQLSTTSSLPSLPTRKSLSFTAKCLIGAAGGGAIGLTIVCASFVAPAFRRVCLPYVPATNEQIRNVLSLLPTDAKGRLLDIGSGDGRIVQSVAQQRLQIISEGVEINPWLVWYSRCKAMLCSPAPLRSRIRFHRKDLWRFDLKSYQYIVIFGVDTMMKDLEAKLLAETQSQTKIIACRFPLPNLIPERTIGTGVDTVWLYEMKLNQKI